MPSDYITKNELRAEFIAFEKRFELKIDNKLEKAVDDFRRYTGALAEDIQSRTQMIAEALHMQIERVDRHEHQNSADNENFDRRISKLESKVLFRRKS
jgi:hypothetical protein